MKLNSIRKKMMFYFITMTLMIGLISLYVSYNSKMLLDEINEMFNTSITLSEIENKLEVTHSSLSQYIQTKSSDALNMYIENSENLASSTETLLRLYKSDKGMLSVENVHNLVLKYNQYSAEAVVAKRGRDAEGSRDKFQSAEEILKNIRELIQNLKLIQLEDNVALYKTLNTNSQKVQVINMIMIIDLIILTIMMVLHVTYRMTTPIIRLAHSANEIASGHFEGEEVIVSDEDEIQMMAKAFNKMRISIRNLIKELKRTNEMEAQLYEKELQTIKMQTLLNKAELRSLQSQINPHFLFNSLNAGVQLAMMEEADLTLEFLENMSAIFRYNIKPLDKTVTVEEELNNIKAYAEMMKVRFGDKLKFDLKTSEEVLPLLIMPLILQPLVENAFIHGIGKKESGGAVFVEAWCENEQLCFRVKDNGIGMTEEQMKRILSENNEHVIPKKSHSSGIGAGNVLQRLILAYGEEICMDIQSTLGVGTEITIFIPWNQVKGATVYKVLIVDDEQIVCDAIKYIISRREDNLTVCGIARSGREAIEQAGKLTPDIIFMDIRMPGINGIEAIKEIKHVHQDIKFVIISAYEQFEFAKQAVQLGVKEYILKPINRAKLNQILDQVIDELDGSRDQKARDLETMERLYNMIPFLETGFIYSILTNSEALPEMKKVINLLNVSCEQGYLMILQFHLNEDDPQTDVLNTHSNLHEKAEQIREIIKYKCNAIVGPLMINKMVIFVPCKQMENDYDSRVESMALAECLQGKLQDTLSLKCSIGISSTVGLSELYYAYGQANKAVCKTVGDEIFHIADLYADHEISIQRLNLQNQMMENLSRGRLEKAIKYFDALFEYVGHQKDSIFELVVLIFRIAHEEGIEENEMLDYSSYLDEMSKLNNLADLYQWIIARMKFISICIQEKKEQKCCALVERTKNILKTNYTDELTLEGVARLQNISPQYLSKLFKEETGYTFVEFLTALRIEYAQKLMVDSEFSIKEICYKVGYSDPNYFSRLFRKQTGFMPKTFIGQYRTDKL